MGIKPPKKQIIQPIKQIQLDKFPLYGQQQANLIGNYIKMVNKPFQGQIHKLQNPSINSKRCGIIGLKLGMTSLWDKWGTAHPVTVIRVDRCQVIQHKTQQKQGYNAIQVGAGDLPLFKINKPLMGHFLKAKVPPKRQLDQFWVDPQNFLPIGYMFSVRHFTPGQFVDVVSRTCGKGMTGTIRRFGFGRQPQTHGNSLTTRVLGSTGMRQDPGRVFKNKKMYGKYGHDLRQVLGLQVYKIDVVKNLLFLKGCLGGKGGTWVRIQDSVSRDRFKQHNHQLLNYPTFTQEENKQYADQLQMFHGLTDPKDREIHDNNYIRNGRREDFNVQSAPKQQED